ncbi:hypothetical protein CYMTET_46111 [Cymbomonas tetramitiformis]|uniref:Uncharacterized protein n=1 Tax=Cymbomonas tetramitiformis TaxID=36881 RepID=A0AAE0EXX3_9CHLO|nr:hypothetical protein CYMTET_46111 [Cymbomonas tetramitiformis]
MASLLDPRYKGLTFKKFKKAWKSDWKPAGAPAEDDEPPAKKKKTRAGIEVVTVADFLGDSDDEMENPADTDPCVR